MKFECTEVWSGWKSVSTPDDCTVVLELDRTTHEFYPALRELVLLYDAVEDGRDQTFSIGTGDYVEIEHLEGDPPMVELDLSPVRITAKRSTVIEALRTLLADIFARKDRMSTAAQRQQGLDSVQWYLDDRGGTLDAETLYECLRHETDASDE